MKKYSEKTAATVIKSMLIHAREDARFKGTSIDCCGSQCALDGMRAFRLAVPVAGLPDLPDDAKPFDLGSIWPDEKTLQELPRPTLDDVSALYAADRKDKGAERRYLWTFGPGLPVLDLIFLRDALRVFPDARLYWNPQKPLAPVVLNSDHGDAIICPMKLKPGANYEPRTIPEKRRNAAPAFTLSQFAARYAA